MNFVLTPPQIPQKHQPRGLKILHEDQDILVINKSAGLLSVAALWNKDETAENLLNLYVKKGSLHSKKKVFTVHRLDQATSGLLVFAKSEDAQNFLKNNWTQTIKHYFTIIQGHPKDNHKIIESYLAEDDDYSVKSVQHAHPEKIGKLARTEYQVVQQTKTHSLLKINLLTGKKNQIRVHLSEMGHPIVGDIKYGYKPKNPKMKSELFLHSFYLEIDHPYKKNRACFHAEVPLYFKKLIEYDYK